MITFTTLIRQFGQMGEKTGWTYVSIEPNIAEQLKTKNKKSFRVKGFLDSIIINGLALLPIGDGNFILPLNVSLRKKLGKEAGAMLNLQLTEDKNFVISMPEDLRLCLDEEELAQQNFDKLAKSHQHYFINWINSAKTIETRTKRIAMTVNAMLMGFNYGQMIRYQKQKKA